jgi:hypothetical protein
MCDNSCMSVITKTIGKRKYSYLAIREGKKVVHKYLGSFDDPKVSKITLIEKETSTVPIRFSSLFWDTSLSNVHLKRNARYIIERILEFGDIDALEWLQRIYPVKTIIHVLYLNKVLSERSRNFWTLWFGVGDA